MQPRRYSLFAIKDDDNITFCDFCDALNNVGFCYEGREYTVLQVSVRLTLLSAGVCAERGHWCDLICITAVTQATYKEKVDEVVCHMFSVQILITVELFRQ
jgi:hypothetical protein